MDYDDLDKLLDEVEKKFGRDVSVACSSRESEKCSNDKNEQRKHSAAKPEQPISVSEDIDALLEELLEDDYSNSPQPKTEPFPKGPKTEKLLWSHSGGRKCCPVFIGGSSVTNGVGTATSKRSCDQLRCTSCDFQVLMFDDSEWDVSCDYLFLRYKDLHVFQLENPTRVIEWTSEKTVCVAGYSSPRNEILELRLPLKLFADENKGLCAERDFKVVHGGFTEGPVRHLRHVPGSRCAVTNDGRSSDLQVWDLGGDDSDVIRRAGSVEGRSVSDTGSRIAARLSAPPQVLHGARSSDVQLTQLTSGQTLCKLDTDSAELLSSLQFVSDSVFLASCCNGCIYVADTRTSAAPQRSTPPPRSGDSVCWWSDASIASQLSSTRIVRLSSSGDMVVTDLRNLGGIVSQAQLDVQTHPCQLEDVSVSWSPVLDGCIAVSGFDGVVQIYNTRLWRTELQDAQPLFQHCGHMVLSEQTAGSAPIVVTSHLWHPERPRMLLSAASDGSVHVWDWVEPETTGDL
ncbi:cilia- and flagella-associated protein 418 isoform X2 [Nothobranchius furzeri]|uniref:Transcript variant X1 n=1 Tax=Nothobranchius furzeri TaxID=105023 RepID=A0A8C6LZ13_NOTFU|nr:transcript variant X1 [Nothobranchius furzeri]